MTSPAQMIGKKKRWLAIVPSAIIKHHRLFRLHASATRILLIIREAEIAYIKTNG
jgi:hypothetical protein